MRVVILAAGMGIRIRPLTNNKPKAFLEIENIPLIVRSLSNLNYLGFRDVIIVVGYKKEYFKRSLGNNFKNIKIQYIENKQYSKTGSMYSLYQTKGSIDEDILLLESDLLFERRALSFLIESDEPNEILIAPVSGSGDEVYICIDQHNNLLNLGKNINNKSQAVGELVGISKVSLEFLNQLYEVAERDFKNHEMNYHYEEVIYKLSKTYPIKCTLINDLNWIEIDTLADLERAKKIIYPKIKEKENVNG